MENFAMLVDDREEPLPVVTRAGIDDWRSKGILFKVEYDLLNSSSGIPQYRVLYTMMDQNHPVTSVLLKGDGAELAAEVLFGWGGVQVHHAAFGDGRELRFRANDRVQLF